MYLSPKPDQIVPVYRDLTVALDSSMSADEIQRRIDAVPRLVSSRLGLAHDTTVTIQFADGTYALGFHDLVFSGFWGGGHVILQGNVGESGIHENQAVVIQTQYPPRCEGNGPVHLRFLNLRFEVATGGVPALDLLRCLGTLEMDGCSFENSATGHGLQFTDCGVGHVYNCRFAKGDYGIRAVRSLVHSYDNDSKFAAEPDYGLYASETGIIAKRGTQPLGDTANEQTEHGGIIR